MVGEFETFSALASASFATTRNHDAGIERAINLIATLCLMVSFLWGRAGALNRVHDQALLTLHHLGTALPRLSGCLFGALPRQYRPNLSIKCLKQSIGNAYEIDRWETRARASPPLPDDVRRRSASFLIALDSCAVFPCCAPKILAQHLAIYL